MKEIIDYAKNIGLKAEFIEWIEKNIKNFKTQTEGEHITDYLMSSKAPKRVTRATYKQIKENTKKWNNALIKKGEHIKETKKDTEVVIDFKDGFKAVKLIGENAYKREGFLMRHCVESYYNKDDEIYSIRDKKNIPHATLSKSSQQIKGKGNGSINPKYIKYVVKLLESLKVNVRENEMKNLGYVNVTKFKKHLHKDSVKELFKSKYWYMSNKLLDKSKEIFYCFEMLDSIPLVEYVRDKIKINFELSIFIEKSIKFLMNSLNNIKSGDYCKTGVSGDYCKTGVSGYSCQTGVSGYSCKTGVSGNSCQTGVSGNSCKTGVSGNSCKTGVSGYSCQTGVSGDYCQTGVSGNYCQTGVSGDSCKTGVSGNSCQTGVSGDSCQTGVSGDYCQTGVSGDSCQTGVSGYSCKTGVSGNSCQTGVSGNSCKTGVSGNSCKTGVSGDSCKTEIKGKNSVCADIGYRGQIKGVKGTWITLAEYDSNCIVKFVKSAKIDGVKLKENVWYKLENKKFVEVKQ